MPFHGLKSRRKRRLTLVTSCLSFFVLLIVHYGWHQYSNSLSKSKDKISIPNAHPLLTDHARFWKSLYRVISDNRPRCKRPPEVVVPENLEVSYEDDHTHERPDILWLEHDDLEALKTAHKSFLDEIQTAQIRLVYQKGTRGIITTVSDSRIPILLVQLRMLRLAGSLLPVEVFLSRPTSYADHLCTHLLSHLDTTCVYLSDIFTSAGEDVDISTYQFKIFAILFSSFDEILLLDSDAWPISSPDHLFLYPPFTTAGLVLWPDFWYASESPYYFSIAGIGHPPALQERPATESGELMYAKSKHEISILLAAYYNYYGPDYYYPLLSQGAPGQGDKETFGNAALALEEEFYTVKKMVTAIGRLDSSGHFIGTAMVQYDPIVDLQQYDKVSLSSISPSTTIEDRSNMQLGHQQGQRQSKQAEFLKQTNKPMFIHANVPKFDPRNIFNEHDIGGIRVSPVRDSNGTYVRCWNLTPEKAQQRFGYDVEKRLWEVIRTVACHDLLDRDRGRTSRNSKEFSTCAKVERYVKHVFRDDENDSNYNYNRKNDT